MMNYTIGGFSFDAQNIVTKVTLISPIALSFGSGLLQASGTPLRNQTVGALLNPSNLNHSLVLGEEPLNGSADTRSDIQLSWGGLRLASGDGNDFFVYENGNKDAPEAFAVAVRLASTGTFTNFLYQFYDTFDDAAVNGPNDGVGVFSTAFDLSDFGLPAGDSIDAIRIINLKSTDKVSNEGGDGFVDLSGLMGFSPLTTPNGSPFAEGRFDPDITLVAASRDLIPANTVTLAVNLPSTNENGADNLVYTFSRTGSLTDSLTVNFNVSGTATFNNDYTQSGGNIFNATQGSIVFSAGSSTAILTLNPTADTLVEPNETIAITLSGGTDYVIGTLSAIESLITNDDGDANANELIGGRGNDRLDGKAGADTLIGGLGNDTYIVDNTGDTITEGLDEGTDAVQASVTFTLVDNVENLTLTGTDAINGTGNSLNNQLTGNSADNTLIGLGGNDRLDGKVGADTLIGGLGDDTYIVDNTGDTITESLNEGTDAVQASVTFTLADNLENLTLTGINAINGTGNTLNNRLTGNSADNLLTGGDGNDVLAGNGGRDILVGGAGNDTLNLGLNDGVDDTIRYVSGDGTDTINQFIKGTDKLAFIGISSIDVIVSGSNTQLRLGDGISNNSNFGTGTLLATIRGVTGFTINELGGAGGTSLDSSNEATFLFS